MVLKMFGPTMVRFSVMYKVMTSHNCTMAKLI